jgi:hypothetical protein
MVHKLPMFGRRIIGGAVDGFFEWKAIKGHCSRLSVISPVKIQAISLAIYRKLFEGQPRGRIIARA